MANGGDIDAGITCRSGPDAAANGRRACQLMDLGHPEADFVTSMADENNGFTTDAAATESTQLAGGDFCPQHTGGAATPPRQQPNPPQFFPWPFLPSL